MITLNTYLIKSWKPATKTKSITCRVIDNLIDDSLISKLLLDTLEGNEPLRKGSVICKGELGDVWQQTTSKLLKKYTVVDLLPGGWVKCNPKPDNLVNCIQITEESFNILGDQFNIIGHYGEKWNGIDNVQFGVPGDYICQQIDDPTDVWIVKRKIFENTYSIQ